MYEEKIFENIKHFDSFDNEYWEARELQKILEYAKWQKFLNVINKAIIACKSSGYNGEDHFTQVGKMINLGKKALRKVIDYRLTRYACYLIVQNGDPKKEVIALGQTYFAIQTRRQELSEKEYDLLTEVEKRFYQRSLTKKGNYYLNKTAKDAGVKNFDKFHNCGYQGLYGGETADAIAKRKKLRYREDILDNMGSEELAANLFRITQTDAKLKRDEIKNEKDANNTHFEMGKDLRQFIAKKGGTMPEKLPTPKKSLKELEKLDKKGAMIANPKLNNENKEL
jgi:DNA-damage-inducible protein D